jgi:multidrug efflux pump subunit AcrA (membrane-fusion protein)
MGSMSQSPDRTSLEQQSEMLPQDPPPRLIRLIGWLMVVMFLTALTGVIVGKVPETVRSPFVLVPTDGADPIQAPRLATVAQVHVTAGQRVAAGTELFVLRSDQIRSWRTELTTATSDLNAKAASIVKAEASYLDRLNIKKSEIAQARRELEFRQQLWAPTRSADANDGARQGRTCVEGHAHRRATDFDQAQKEVTMAPALESADLERQRTEAEQAAWRMEAHRRTRKVEDSNRRAQSAAERFHRRPAVDPGAA